MASAARVLAPQLIKHNGDSATAAIVSARESLVALAGLLAASGITELVFQRIVYRVGVHIPRQGAFLSAYRFATVSGDFAFKTTAVLLAVTAVLALLFLWRARSYTTAVLLGALIVANVLAWPFGLRLGAATAPIVFAFGAAWLAGQSLGQRGFALRLAVAAAGVALVLTQYRSGMTALGREPGAVSALQTASEVSLLVAAAMIGLAAARGRTSARVAIMSLLLTLALLVSYVREPATVAIVSLWATGVTMSLPGALYIAAFGAVAFAALTWARGPETRHLAIAVALLMVAGLQPQALHHGLTAFLGLALFNLKPTEASGSPDISEAENAD